MLIRRCMSRRGLQLIQVLSITWRGCPRRQLFPRNRSLLFDFPPARRAATSCNANREKIVNKQTAITAYKNVRQFLWCFKQNHPPLPLNWKNRCHDDKLFCKYSHSLRSGGTYIRFLFDYLHIYGISWGINSLQHTRASVEICFFLFTPRLSAGALKVKWHLRLLTLKISK